MTMPEESVASSAAAATPPRLATTTAPTPIHRRVQHGLRRPHNWIQLVKFFAVGGSGYVVNLATFWVAHDQIRLHHLASATIAFVFAVFNNFWWNRHWTFGARAGHAGFQAARFFAVSVVAFFFALAVLQLLIDNTNLPDLVAQAISIVVATPLNFLGNKMWSFAHRPRA
jgi:dolichol-phosphate mannosyltransferase